MGSPISAPLADLVMEHLKNQILPTLNFPIPFFKRYVDDIITAVLRDKIDTILTAFNNFHPNLQFTFETETDNKISFLDIELTKKHNGQIITNWFRKPTHTGRYLNFHSSHPLTHKIKLVKNLKTQ